VEEARANDCTLLLKPVVPDPLRALIIEKLRSRVGTLA
jgi:hypothetical protein